MTTHNYDAETGEIVHTESVTSLPKDIASAIVTVKGQVRALGYDEKNQHGGYRYVSVDKFYDTLGVIMAKAGLFVLMDEIASDVKEGAPNRDGRVTPWLFVRYEIRFAHASGALSHPVHRSLAQPISGPQSFGAAQSYIEKQFLRQVFKIPTGEKDADAEDNSENAEPVRTATARKQISKEVVEQTRVSKPAIDKEQLRVRLKTMQQAIDEAGAVALNSIMESDDIRSLFADLRETLGEPQGGAIVDNLLTRIEKRRKQVAPHTDEKPVEL